MSELKNLKKVPDNAVVVADDVVKLYPSIQHNEGLEVLKKQFVYFYKKKKYLMKIWLKWLNSFIKTKNLSLTRISY